MGSDDRARYFRSVSARRHRRDKLAERHGRRDADVADARAALVQQVGQLRRGGRGGAGQIRARHADARVREEGCADRRGQPDVRAVPQLHEDVLQREVPARAAEAARAVHRGRARGRRGIQRVPIPGHHGPQLAGLTSRRAPHDASPAPPALSPAAPPLPLTASRPISGNRS